jgi:hypothetical protein
MLGENREQRTCTSRKCDLEKHVKGEKEGRRRRIRADRKGHDMVFGEEEMIPVTRRKE